MKELMKTIIKMLFRGKDVSEQLNISSDISLLVTMNSKVLAKLFFDNINKEFCLVYTNDFEGSGLKPFHEPTSESSSIVEIDKIYRSKILWYPFALRIPNPDRSDYDIALEEAGLTGDESPLEIMGKISNYSISKPWVLKVSKEKNKYIA